MAVTGWLLVRYWRGHSDSVNGIAFLAADQQVVTAGYDGVLQRRGIDGELQQELTGLVPITHMEADDATDRLLTGHRDGSVRLWKASDFTLLSEQQLHSDEVKAVAIDLTRTRYASSSEDSSVAVWTEGGEVRYLEEPGTDAWTLAFSPDGDWLSGGTWFRLYRWNLDDGSLAVLPTEHYGLIRAVQYTGEGERWHQSVGRLTAPCIFWTLSAVKSCAAFSGMICVVLMCLFRRTAVTWQRPVMMPVCVSGCWVSDLCRCHAANVLL